MVFALIALSLITVVILSSGTISMWALIGIGLFNSIMWSNIFTLAIKDLKEYTSQGSSLLITAIVGGAILPVIQAYIGDVAGLKTSFIIPLLAYVYISWYGWKCYKSEIF